MDSKIRDKIINSAIEAACNCEGHKDGSVAAGFLGLAISNAIDDALLTAEPEPCKAADWWIKATKEAENTVEYWKAIAEDAHDIFESELAKTTQVADKRSEELRAQVDRLRSCMEDIEQSAIDFEDSAEQLDLDLCGLAQVEEIKHKAREALAATEPKP